MAPRALPGDRSQPGDRSSYDTAPDDPTKIKVLLPKRIPIRAAVVRLVRCPVITRQVRRPGSSPAIPDGHCWRGHGRGPCDTSGIRDLGFPARMAAAGVLLTDPDGLTLLLRTHSRTDLVLPGGIVEADEPPAAAAEREVREEVGLNVVVTRLLTVQHRIAERGLPERMMFVFDTAPLPNRPPLILQADEIAEAFWLTADEAVAPHVEGGRSRLNEAFATRLGGVTTYLDADRKIPARQRSCDRT